MTLDEDTIKHAVLTILSRGQATGAEAAKLSGRSRQLVRHWAKELPKDSRAEYLRKQWAEALRECKFWEEFR